MRRIWLLGLLLLAGCGEQPSAQTNSHPAGATPYSAAEQAVITQGIERDANSALEQEAVAAAVQESRVQSDLSPENLRVFEYRGEKTVCGELADSTGRVRFIYRNNNAVVETNHRREVFNEFWAICPG